MSAKAGRYGEVMIGASVLALATNWTCDFASDTSQFAVLNTEFKKAVAGARSANGSVDAKWDFAQPLSSLLRDGSEVTLKLYIDKTNTKHWSFSAIVSNVSVNTQADGGEPVSFSFSFQSNGDVTDSSS